MKTIAQRTLVLTMLFVSPSSAQVQVSATQVQGIFSAIVRGDLAEVKELVKRGVDLSAGFGGGPMTVIEFAAFNGRGEIAEYLLDAGAKIPALNTQEGRDLLAWGLKAGSVKFLEKYLLQDVCQ